MDKIIVMASGNIVQIIGDDSIAGTVLGMDFASIEARLLGTENQPSSSEMTLTTIEHCTEQLVVDHDPRNRHERRMAKSRIGVGSRTICGT